MQLNLYYVVTWAVLAVVVLVLAAYRIKLDHHEDDIIHLSATEGSLLSKQTVLAGKIRTVTRWGEALTVVAVVYGVTLLAVWAYRAWEQSNQIQFH
ncbi:MAG TPA: hypothetical protein VL523_07735 [Terriglobia bacterium]|nr:hypothetical protein [Terriglobia bacterium]